VKPSREVDLSDWTVGDVDEAAKAAEVVAKRFAKDVLEAVIEDMAMQFSNNKRGQAAVAVNLCVGGDDHIWVETTLAELVHWFLDLYECEPDVCANMSAQLRAQADRIDKAARGE
jgi:hypothetical protein